jgi:UTP--glucose-1-phosphate uridylyltransferase
MSAYVRLRLLFPQFYGAQDAQNVGRSSDFQPATPRQIIQILVSSTYILEPMQKLEINKAVFPVAGLGTRFLPATKAQPKEMLPVVDKPLIQYAVEEAYAAGIRHMIFVTGRNKRAIEDHFDTSYELENELEMSNKHALLAVMRSVTPDDMNFSYVRQPRSLGLGHAVLCAEHLVGDEAFAVLLADDLMVGPPGGDSVLAQMVKQFDELQQSMLAVQEVPAEHTRRYGIVAGDVVSPGLMKVKAMVEKPAPEVAPSRMGVAGRYILTPAIFGHIRNQASGVGGEIQLTDGISSLLRDESVYAFQYQGKRYDCGSKEGFLEASVELALLHSEVGAHFRNYLENLQIGWSGKERRVANLK